MYKVYINIIHRIIISYYILFQIQFVTFIIHSGYNYSIDCDFPKGFSIALFAYPASLIVLFGNFYYQSYVKRQSRSKKCH